MSNYNYDGSNPYQRGQYSQGGYEDGSYSQPQGGYGGNNVEMSSGGHIAILNECRYIDDIIRGLDDKHQHLRMLHDKAAYEAGNEPDSRTNQDITAVLNEIRDTYRSLGDRMKNLASKPESQTPRCKPQVDRAKRSLKDSAQNFATLQSQLEQEKNQDIERQYRIVNAGASEAEVRNYMNGVQNGQEDPNQLFQQALMQSSRVEGANRKLSALKARNQALQQIERQMAELLELFTQMDTIVAQQDEQVTHVHQTAEDATGDLNKATTEIETAVETARATRRKKWWCMGICVAIILVIVIIVVIYMAVTGKFSGGDDNNGPSNDGNNPAKRDIPDLIAHIRGGPARLIAERSRPISRITGRNLVDTTFGSAEGMRSVKASDV